MDDTHQSRASDAAATRKRRSSILKSQRPARTPFSELEFNVATPTDTAKSRRVSFSRRTGVAEFVTNEGTTTWKNFYEEQNKSLESSGNDSNANPSHQPIGHLGKRIFDQQFEEVEAVDFIGNPMSNANGSLNNVNFADHLASLECTADGKLTAPQNNFELSAFTDHQSKLFGNEFTAPCVGEMSGRIDVNFSAMQLIEDTDELDKIQRDLERASNNMVCHGPFSDRQNTSEYIEVNLNITHAPISNEEDMSLTGSIHSPVQDLHKSCSVDKKVDNDQDLVTDKENIAVNPYAAPRESANFAINDEPDQVLIFDGKRLTLQSDKPEHDKSKNYRQTLLPFSSAETPQRKTIVLNVNDDLPNFLDDMLNSKCENIGFSRVPDFKSETMYNEHEIFMTLPVNRVETVPRKPAQENTGNISMTQALTTNIISGEAELEKSDARRTIVYEEGTGNISITQAIPTEIITNYAKIESIERRRTVVFIDDTANISLTQAVPTNIIVNENPEGNEKRKTIVFDDEEGNISVTQAISSNILLPDKVPDKRKTIVFDYGEDNVSITQAVPANVVLSDLQENRQTIIIEHDSSDISVTQALLSNVILAHSDETEGLPENDETEALSEKRLAVAYEDEILNISLTQALPTNILLEKNESDRTRSDIGYVPTTQSLPTNIKMNDSDNKRRTILYEDNSSDISITQAIPSQLIPGYRSNVTSSAIDNSPKFNTSCNNKELGKKRMTIVYNNDDISMTQAIPANIMLPEEGTSIRKTILFDNDDANITKAIPINVFLLDQLDSAVDQSIKISKNNVEEKGDEMMTEYDIYQDTLMKVDLQESRKTAVFYAEDCDAEMSIIDAIPKVQNLILEAEKQKTMFDNDNGNTSMTKPIPAELSAFQKEVLNKSRNKQLDLLEQGQAGNPCPGVIVYQATTNNSTHTMQSNRTDRGDTQSDRPMDCNSKSDAIVTSVIEDVANIPASCQDSVEDEIRSDDHSLIKHPLLEAKSEKMNLSPLNMMVYNDQQVADITERPQEVIETKDKHLQIIEKPKDSVLNTLLDMSTSSMESSMIDQSLMARIESKRSSEVDIQKVEDTDTTSTESMFYITRDSDEEVQTDITKDVDVDKKKIFETVERPGLVDRPLLPFKDDDSPAVVTDLQKKLAQLKTVESQDKKALVNRLLEKIVSSSPEGVVERDENVQLREQSMTFKKANDTQELLDMISDFTDRKDDDDEEPYLVKVKGKMALENKSQVHEPRRLTFATNRQSIVLSREDLLSNISMAHAALQKSRLELDDSDCLEEDTRDASMDHSLPKKSNRISNEVVKTLNFDDESMSETNLRKDTKASPLKKTAFGETSYMSESKVKVIPTYLKDVSDGIKELMMDLVKPVTDGMPFVARGVDKCVRKAPSTQSTQIQANLLTSSQIEIDTEMYSNPESAYDIDKMSFLTVEGVNKSRSRSFRSPVKFSTNSSEKSSEFEVPSPRQRYLYSQMPVEQPAPDLLVFDHLNPLNNILLGTIDYSDAHKYNPIKSDETLCDSDRSRLATIHFDENNEDNEYDTEPVTTQYRVEARLSQAMQGDNYSYKQRDNRAYKEDNQAYKQVDNQAYEQDNNQANQQDDKQSLLSSFSKPMSIDQSIDVKVIKLKDNEANTLIAMKGNKELLEASSSLTLVDDAAGQPTSDINFDGIIAPTQDDLSVEHTVKISKSPVHIVYKVEEQGIPVKIDNKDEMLPQVQKCTKAKKRIYSPAADKYKPPQPSLDVTPKPNTKMQKFSNSPVTYRLDLSPAESTKMAAEKDVTENREQVINQTSHTSNVETKKSPRKNKDNHPGTDITLQQLITENRTEADIDRNILDKEIPKTLNPKSATSTEPASQSDVLECNSLEVVSSFTSSKNLNAMKNVHSISITESQQSTVENKSSVVDWLPELISAPNSNLSDPDLGVNVVAKIDMLPFMGSHECEWESSSIDTWSFRLLHGRLRLTARLAHRHDNSIRKRVRGDTPVLDVAVETVQEDKKNPVAILCVRFACETMRYMISRTSRGTCYASDIPPLLRRCAAVARVALRWGRAMHDAKLHLAYTLDNNGYLTLKVANIPLRSVWEVSMRVELVVDNAREAPWPRASDVRVARVVSDVSVPDELVRRALARTPRDWGHAPRTIWRMFRYLKHKTRDDDLLFEA